MLDMGGLDEGFPVIGEMPKCSDTLVCKWRAAVEKIKIRWIALSTFRTRGHCSLILAVFFCCLFFDQNFFASLKHEAVYQCLTFTKFTARTFVAANNAALFRLISKQLIHTSMSC